MRKKHGMRGRTPQKAGSQQRVVGRRLWTWREVAKELLAQGQRMRARLEIQGHYSEGWDVVASFAGKKLSTKKSPNDPGDARKVSDDAS